jgi:hypothetical protein
VQAPERLRPLRIAGVEVIGDIRGSLERGAVDAEIGVRVAPHAAVVLDVWGVGYEETDMRVIQGFATIGVQTWVSPTTWVKGGLGVARVQLDYAPADRYELRLLDVDDLADNDPGLVFAAGTTIPIGRQVLADVEMRAGSGLMEAPQLRVQSLLFQVGLRW